MIAIAIAIYSWMQTSASLMGLGVGGKYLNPTLYLLNKSKEIKCACVQWGKKKKFLERKNPKKTAYDIRCVYDNGIADELIRTS